MPTYQISGMLQITDKGVLVMVRYRQASECRQQYKAPACLPPLLPPLPLPPLVLLSCRSSRLYFLPRMCGGPPAAQRTVARLAAHPLWRCVSIIRRAPQWLDPPSPLCPAPAALPYSRCRRGRRQRRRPHSYRVCEAHLRGGGQHPHASLPVSAPTGCGRMRPFRRSLCASQVCVPLCQPGCSTADSAAACRRCLWLWCRLIGVAAFDPDNMPQVTDNSCSAGNWVQAQIQIKVANANQVSQLPSRRVLCGRQ